jgi:hypothetical protein
MSVLIPDHGYTDHAFIPIDFGGTLIPATGGEEQRLNRLGNRTALRLTTPPLRNRDDGRVMFSRLTRALTQGAYAVVPLSGAEGPSPGSPTVGVAVSGGSALQIAGLTSGYPIVEGQPLSIIHGGRRYLYFSATTTAASGGGTASIQVYPLIRTALTVGDVVELATPMIEGRIEGDPAAWERSAASFAPFAYTIREMA